MRRQPPGPDQLGLWLEPLHSSHHHRTYGLTCGEYEWLRVRCGDRCEICGVRAKEVQKRPLYIDHDGRIGNGFDHVRGLVCSKCNSAMRFVDNGYKKPTPQQQRYLDNSWFWTGLAARRRDTPWLPTTCRDKNVALFSWDNPHKAGTPQGRRPVERKPARR